MALIISRRAGEEITINGNIHVVVEWIGEKRVKLGITAPEEVKISRPRTLEKEVDDTYKSAIEKGASIYE
jgi:carbon storage regulator CsrA